MPTGILTSGIIAIVLSIGLFVFFMILRRRYVRLLPSVFRGAVTAVVKALPGNSSGEANNSSDAVSTEKANQVPLVDAAFRNINYEPLQRRWQQCYRDYREIAGGDAFLDVDEFFAMAPLMEESLERRNALEAPKWLSWAGVFAAGVVLAIGFLLSDGSQFNPYTTIGMAMGVLALSAAFSLQYRYVDARELESCMEDYIDFMARLKESLPPVGRNSLIQTLYRMQNTQKEQLRQQTEQMQTALTSFATDTLSEQMGERFSTSIKEFLHPPIQKMADVQTSVLNRLQHDQQNRLEQLFNLFTKEVGEQLQKQLGGMTDQVNRASGGMRDIVDALHTVAKDAETTLTHNRDAITTNETLQKTLNDTHSKLTERFSEVTILLDDIMVSTKRLAETTELANTATLALVEKSGMLQQQTGERFELLRTTFAEQLGASTSAALALQTGLTTHAEDVRNSLGSYAEEIRASLGSHSDSLRTALAAYAEDVRTSLGEYTLQTAEQLSEQAEAGVRQRDEDGQHTLAALRESVQTVQEQTALLLTTAQEQTVSLLRTAQKQAVAQLAEAQAYSQETARLFGEEARNLFDKFDKQNQAVSQELQAQGRTNANLLSLTNKTLSETTASQTKAFETQTARVVAAFESKSATMADAFASQSTRLVNGWKEDTASFYDSLHTEARDLLQVLPTQMRESFDAFTAAMGETMRASLTDSVTLVDKLGERISQLHSEFELYFSRTEGNTQTQIEDMRFAMEGAVGKFSELSDASLSQLRDGTREAMEAFSQQTQQLMASVDEQTRTISLYVKDMGLDMAELNKGLKESVSEFTAHLHNGVTDTFQEFDKGMAEIVRRMTELGVRIEEAVEALPESIDRLGNGGVK